jgi:hypothetical protein
MMHVRSLLHPHAPARAYTDRAAHLVERIKIEARWHLAGGEHVDPEDDDARHHFLSLWPLIRNRRLPAGDIAAHFYDIASDQGALLAGLIIARRNRTSTTS